MFYLYYYLRKHNDRGFGTFDAQSDKIKNMSIYTKTGDKGKTSLYNGTRVEKSDLSINTVGELDTLNSQIGYLTTLLADKKIEHYNNENLVNIQRKLFTIGSEIATPTMLSSEQYDFLNEVDELEKKIDKYTETLPLLKNFILPGGSQPACFCHIVRSQTRRTERTYSTLITFGSYKPKNINKTIMPYLNRLSDYFFTLARYINYTQGIHETKWE